MSRRGNSNYARLEQVPIVQNEVWKDCVRKESRTLRWDKTNKAQSALESGWGIHKMGELPPTTNQELNAPPQTRVFAEQTAAGKPSAKNSREGPAKPSGIFK